MRIAGLAASSAATGFFLGPHDGPLRALVPAAAVFLLACGSSALNQVQERDIDARMDRTRGRPLPSGALTRAHALGVALLLITLGLSILAQAGSMKPVFLGGLAILWYNGIYTPLKRRTAFAVLPGGVVGAIPPAIGWAAAGGRLFDTRLLALSGLFFLWQIPHFLLLLLRHEGEYRDAGLPTLGAILARGQMKRIIVSWMFATAAAALLLPLFGIVRSMLLFVALLSASIMLVWDGATLLLGRTTGDPAPAAFRRINIFISIVMALISINGIYLRLP